MSDYFRFISSPSFFISLYLISFGDCQRKSNPSANVTEIVHNEKRNGQKEGMKYKTQNHLIFVDTLTIREWKWIALGFCIILGPKNLELIG